MDQTNAVIVCVPFGSWCGSVNEESELDVVVHVYICNTVDRSVEYTQ